MVPGVLIMTTYKLVIIPHRAVRKGLHGHGQPMSIAATAGAEGHKGVVGGVDERYLPFGHLAKEFLQVGTPVSSVTRAFRPFREKGEMRLRLVPSSNCLLGYSRR